MLELLRGLQIGKYFLYIGKKVELQVLNRSKEIKKLTIQDRIIPLIGSAKEPTDIIEISIPAAPFEEELKNKGLKKLPKILLSLNIHSPPKLKFGSLTTDKKIYRPDETVRIICIYPRHGDQDAHLELYKQGKLFWKETKKLSEHGVLVQELDGLEEGEYTARVRVGDIYHSTDFTVMEYRLSPFRAVLKEYIVERGKVHVKISLYILEKKFSGKVDVGLFCGYCDDIVRKFKFDVKDGLLEGDIDISGHTGPFTLWITTKDGLSAQVQLKGTRVEERGEYLCCNMGRKIYVSLSPRKESKKVRGVYYRVLEGDGILRLEDFVGKTAKIRVLREIPQLVIVVYDPEKQTTNTMEFTDIGKDRIISIPVTSTLTAIFAGMIIEENGEKKLREHLGMMFMEEEIKDIKIVCKEKTQGPKIRAKIIPLAESGGKVELIVIAIDDRLLRDDEEVNIGRSYIVYIYELLRSLRDIHSKINRVIKKSMMPRPISRRPILFFQAVSEQVSTIAPSAIPSVKAASVPVAAVKAEEVIPVETVGHPPPPIGGLMPTLEDIAFIYGFKRMVVDANSEVDVEFWVGEEAKTVRIEVIGVLGSCVKRSVARVTVEKNYYLDILAPVYMNEGEECEVYIDYYSSSDATLVVATLEGKQEFAIKAGRGRITIKIDGPTLITAIIKVGDRIMYGKKAEVLPVGEEEVTISEIVLLEPGQKISGEKILLYPSMDYFVKDMAMSLVKYPFGCAEQTSAKLKGLILVYGAFRGVDNEIAEKASQYISAGISRMRLFYKDGLFSLWEDSEPRIDVTVKVLKNLRPAMRLDDPIVNELEEMITSCIETLKSKEYKDSELAELDKAFITDIETVEDAAHILMVAEKNEEIYEKAIKLLKEKAIVEEGYARWPAKKSWAGDKEATALAVRALIHAEGLSEYAKLGLKYILARLIGGMLYSTADTSALLDLMIELKKVLPHGAVAKMNGKEVKIEKPIFVNEVEAKTFIVARRDRKVRINELKDISGMLKVNVSLHEISETGKQTTEKVVVKKDGVVNLKLGQVIKIKVNVEGNTIIPISKIYLPPGLVSMVGGANIQKVIRARSPITIDIIAVRKSEGTLRVVTRDMYQYHISGISKPIKVKVVE